MLGYGAVKYADLKSNRNSNYIFDYDRMLDPRGNTAVYMLYTGARLCSILRKAGAEVGSAPAQALLAQTTLTLEHPAELAVAGALIRFQEANPNPNPNPNPKPILSHPTPNHNPNPAAPAPIPTPTPTLTLTRRPTRRRLPMPRPTRGGAQRGGGSSSRGDRAVAIVRVAVSKHSLSRDTRHFNGGRLVSRIIFFR